MNFGGLLAAADWGSVPEWFGAIGTIAAVVVALASSASSKEQLATERLEAAEDRKRFREQHEREMLDARRSYASRVSVTEDRYDGPNSHLLIAEQWTVRNAGAAAIRDVYLVVRDDDDDLPTVIGRWPVVEGGGFKRVIKVNDAPRGPRHVRFTDLNGIRWLLTDTGDLREVSDADPPVPTRTFPVSLPA